MTQILNYQFQVDADITPRDAYRLYSALLQTLPPAIADELHNSQSRPISQYVAGNIWNVSILGESSCGHMESFLDTLTLLRCDNGRRLIPLHLQGKQAVSDAVNLLLTELPERFALNFVTPTAFKCRGNYQLLPTPRLILQSLLRRWNDCFSEEAYIENADEGLAVLEEGFCCHRIRLDTRTYSFKNQELPGFVGSLVVSNCLHGQAQQILNAMLQFSTFAGVGIKTGLGMGGVQITEK